MRFILHMLEANLAKHLSDAIKQEKSISERFPWAYLHDLYRCLIAHLSPVQQELNNEEMLVLIDKIVKVIKTKPLSFGSYFSTVPEKRREKFQQYLKRYVTPIIQSEIRKKQNPNLLRRRNLFKKIFGLA